MGYKSYPLLNDLYIESILSPAVRTCITLAKYEKIKACGLVRDTVIPQLRLQTWFKSCSVFLDVLWVWVSQSQRLTQKLSKIDEWRPPSCFSHFQASKSEKESPVLRGYNPLSDLSTGTMGWLHRTNWCHVSCHHCSLGSHISTERNQRKTSPFKHFTAKKKGTDLQKSSSFLKHILCGGERAHALWPWGAPNASLTNWTATWTSHFKLIAQLGYSITSRIFSVTGKGGLQSRPISAHTVQPNLILKAPLYQTTHRTSL